MKGLVITPKMIANNKDCPTTFCASAFSLAPKSLATSAVVPALSAQKIIVMTKFKAPANPTAATAVVPNLPTMIMSTMKTAMCKTFSNKTGSAS